MTYASSLLSAQPLIEIVLRPNLSALLHFAASQFGFTYIASAGSALSWWSDGVPSLKTPPEKRSPVFDIRECGSLRGPQWATACSAVSATPRRVARSTVQASDPFGGYADLSYATYTHGDFHRCRHRPGPFPAC